MRNDYQEILNSYNDILPVLEAVAKALEEELLTRLKKANHVDRIICRCKSIDSFMVKALKRNDDESFRYKVPLKEIQDKIGARIIVYYKSDIPKMLDIVLDYFRRIEEKLIVPDDVTKFGYEGFHMICKIPSTIFQLKNNPLVGDFFELQIKTLYQHAWSQSNHALGYKPGQKLKDEEVRLLAFIAAQSWGADKALVELAAERDK
jgi:ppGpp synthetase/RelA/SpoT-type nucleotidyltranferase